MILSNDKTMPSARVLRDAICEELGWKPKMKISEGLKWTYDYYKNKLETDIRKLR